MGPGQSSERRGAGVSSETTDKKLPEFRHPDLAAWMFIIMHALLLAAVIMLFTGPGGIARTILTIAVVVATGVSVVAVQSAVPRDGLNTIQSLFINIGIVTLLISSIPWVIGAMR